MARVIVGREIRFSASHQLPFVPAGHKCSRCHGHSYRIQVEITGPIVEPTGWIFDFGMLDAVMRQLVYDALDHRHLNDIKGLENPTAEVLADWIATRVALGIPTSGVSVHSVTVHEGDGGGWARLEPDAATSSQSDGSYTDRRGIRWNDPRDMDSAGGR